MIDLTNIIKSETFLIVCILVILISGLSVTIHLVKKNASKRKQKQNTKELNDTLSMEILDEKNSPVVVIPDEKEETAPLPEPVVVIDNDQSKIDVVESLTTGEVIIDDNNIVEEDKVELLEEEQPKVIEEELTQNIEKEEKKQENIYEVNEEENLVYAPIELNEEEAKEELEKLTQELVLKEQEENIEENTSIELTNFEKEQEENAIISLDELMSRATDIYNQNETVQYEDEGDEPITIEQLQERWEQEKNKINEIKQEEILEEIIEPIKEDAVVVPEREEKKLRKVEFPSILPSKKEGYESKFKNSPIISPVYGIERKKFEEEEKLHPEVINKNDLALENTANYDKFDEEIRKTNEFIAALKELQKKLD